MVSCLQTTQHLHPVLMAGNRNRHPNANAFPITTPPPWSKSELNKKQVGALKQMLTAYDIQEGHGWRKADIVKELFQFSENWVVEEESKEEEQPENSVNAADPGMHVH